MFLLVQLCRFLVGLFDTTFALLMVSIIAVTCGLWILWRSRFSFIFISWQFDQDLTHKIPNQRVFLLRLLGIQGLIVARQQFTVFLTKDWKLVAIVSSIDWGTLTDFVNCRRLVIGRNLLLFGTRSFAIDSVDTFQVFAGLGDVRLSIVDFLAHWCRQALVSLKAYFGQKVLNVWLNLVIVHSIHWFFDVEGIVLVDFPIAQPDVFLGVIYGFERTLWVLIWLCIFIWLFMLISRHFINWWSHQQWLTLRIVSIVQKALGFNALFLSQW